MIIDNYEEEESNIRMGLPIVKIYNCNKKFKNKTYFQSNKFDISLKNYTSLMNFHNKLESMIKETKPISIKEELDFLYESLDFDPKLYKNPKTFIMFNDEKREICKELCKICDEINQTGKSTLMKITETYNLNHVDNPLKKTTVNRYLKASKYSFKKCSVRNPILCSDEYYLRKLYVIDVLMSKIHDEYLVICIDETPLNTIEHSDYYWSSNHCRKIYKRRRKKTGVNMIMAVEIDTIFHFSIDHGCNDSVKFWNFVNVLLSKIELIEEYKLKVRSGKVLLFFDNASIHYGHLNRQRIVFYSFEILYNVPYESNFNPIERVFRSIKSRIKRDLYSDINEVKNAYLSAINEMSSSEITNIWKQTVKEMFSSLKPNINN